MSRDKDDNESSEPPRKKLKGQNKHRPREKRTPKSEKLCFKIGSEGSCPYGDKCCYSHDVTSYLEKKALDIAEKCYLYETFGKCPYSFSCRFGSHHLKDSTNLVIDKLWEESKTKTFYLNTLNKDLQKSLRKREYDFKKSADAMSKFNAICDKKTSTEQKVGDDTNVKKESLCDGSFVDKSTSDEKQIVDSNKETEPSVFMPEKKKVTLILVQISVKNCM